MVSLNHTPSLADTTGMAHSLESRSPFLDREVLEFSASLPPGYKVKFFKTHKANKYILKKVATNYMPEDMVFVDKYPCGNFINAFAMMKTIWKLEIEELLFDYGRRLQDLFSLTKSRAMWSKFKEDRLPIDESYLLLKFLIFMIWHKEVMEKICSPNLDHLQVAETAPLCQ
jgi:asparagine synthase (glutamine-hydrolysing)